MRKQAPDVTSNLLGPIGSHDGIAAFVPANHRGAYMRELHAGLKDATFEGANITLPPERLERLLRLARYP